MLALYSEYQSYFSCEERKILRNLLLTMGIQSHGYSGSGYLENFVSYAYYADYFQAYENLQRIFPGFENNTFISPFAGITNYNNHTVPPGVEIIEHTNEIDFTNLLVPANTSLTVTSNVRIKSGPASSASSGSYFHAYIGPAECPGLAAGYGICKKGSTDRITNSTIAVGTEYSEQSTVDNEVMETKSPQYFPNPFHSITNITYTIMQLQPVTLTIKNILGKEVARLINNETQDAACYKKEFNSTLLKPGVYFYILQTGSSVQTQKMVKISQ